MSAPATPANQSPLEVALREVRATLDELLLRSPVDRVRRNDQALNDIAQRRERERAQRSQCARSDEGGPGGFRLRRGNSQFWLQEIMLVLSRRPEQSYRLGDDI